MYCELYRLHQRQRDCDTCRQCKIDRNGVQVLTTLEEADRRRSRAGG